MAWTAPGGAAFLPLRWRGAIGMLVATPRYTHSTGKGFPFAFSNESERTPSWVGAPRSW
jgi:hypothetical protein